MEDIKIRFEKKATEAALEIKEIIFLELLPINFFYQTLENIYLKLELF